jgi:hypothetical protein
MSLRQICTPPRPPKSQSTNHYKAENAAESRCAIPVIAMVATDADYAVSPYCRVAYAILVQEDLPDRAEAPVWAASD